MLAEPKISLVMRTLSDPTRRAIFERIVAARETTVGVLTRDAGVSQPAVSQHVKVLLEASLVVGRRAGRSTFYRADEPRSAMPEFEGGVVVHDHWRAYLSLENVDHAFCNAHLLRELQAVCELDKEPWAEALRATLLDANEAVRTAKAQGAAALAPETIKAFEQRYWAAVREGLALHRSLPTFDPSTNPKKRKKQRPAHNLLIRFKTFKEATLRFLADFTVPFTNNLAEQDLRMMKVKAKISGGFRTPQGAADFARLRSVISSAGKHGFNISKALALTPERLAAHLKL